MRQGATQLRHYTTCSGEIMSAKRAPKGSVSVSVNRGWLRLRWKHRGQSYTLAIGLSDSVINRNLAERKAQLIQADIEADRLTPGVFDPSLAKYRDSDASQALSVVQLFEKYIEYKRRTLPDPRSLEKYRGLLGHLNKYFKTRSSTSLDESRAFEFRDWLLKKLKPLTVRERIGLLRSCWNWAIQKKLLAENPWSEVRVKVPSKTKPSPFTAEEVGRILAYSRSTEKYQAWADLIEFCFSVGCRPGEAAGLQWQHLSSDCGFVWVSESFGRGRQKGTKTNQSRAFEVFPELQTMLLARRPEAWQSGDHVFTAPRGGPIDDHNFRRRCWKPLLEDLGIPYRKPYITRHTFASHALESGWSVAEIAAVTGNSEETIMRNYLGNPHGKAKVFRIFKPSDSQDDS